MTREQRKVLIQIQERTYKMMSFYDDPMTEYYGAQDCCPYKPIDIEALELQAKTLGLTEWQVNKASMRGSDQAALNSLRREGKFKGRIGHLKWMICNVLDNVQIRKDYEEYLRTKEQ